MTAASTTAPPSPAPKFTQGSTMRHVVVMTATGSIGLMAIFVVDFLNLFYIALLGEQELAAAIGYAGTLLFFTISLCIGISIAGTALVSRALGARRRDEARRLATSSLVFMAAVDARAHAADAAAAVADPHAVRRDRAHPRDRVALPADRDADHAADGPRHGVLRGCCARRATPGAPCM